jgi:hypothetical protein
MLPTKSPIATISLFLEIEAPLHVMPKSPVDFSSIDIGADEMSEAF